MRLQLSHPAHAVLDLGDDLGLAVEVLDVEVRPELLDERQKGDGLAERDRLSLQPRGMLVGRHHGPSELEEQA